MLSGLLELLLGDPELIDVLVFLVRVEFGPLRFLLEDCLLAYVLGQGCVHSFEELVL